MSKKILVMSDIHNAGNTASAILGKEKDANVIVFLGDGEEKFEVAMAENGLDICGSKSMQVYQVSGNCDGGSLDPSLRRIEIEGIRFCISHGHGHSVKSKTGLSGLAEYASTSGCKAALFGHTHRQFFDEISGVKMFNPGAVQNGQYGVVTISDGHINFEHTHI